VDTRGNGYFGFSMMLPTTNKNMIPPYLHHYLQVSRGMGKGGVTTIVEQHIVFLCLWGVMNPNET
jgi:hypothetical protein